MLYRIEGIKRAPDKWPECPRPVYIVFDPIVLTLDKVRLSDANMAAKRTIWGEASDRLFNGLPFNDIYERGAIPKDPQAESALGFDPDAARRFSRRQAEVLVPNELALGYARRLIFRSEAERDLAFRDSGGFPPALGAEVNKDWFFAARLARPYMDTFTSGPEGRLQVANARRGDAVVQVGHARTGAVQAWATIYGASAWEPWAAVDHVALGLPKPPAGRRTFYLYGHRVAEEDF